MIRALPSVPRRIFRTLVPGLVLLAFIGGLAPIALPPPVLYDSFEVWPGIWTAQDAGANVLDAGAPSLDVRATRASGAWDGRQALRVEYAGGGTGAEAIASAGAISLAAGSLQLMLYVPSITFAHLPNRARFQIARLMGDSTDVQAPIALYLARGSGGNDRLYLQVDYAVTSGQSSIGSETTTGIAPDTWHTVELSFDSLGGAVLLHIDDLSRSRASGGGLDLQTSPVGAVSVGLTEPAPIATAMPLVWWIDDVRLAPGFLGHGPPRLHYHQDGFEAPNISALADPAGKSLVATSGGSTVLRIPAGHRDAGMECDDPSGTSDVLSAAYGELTGMDAGTGKLYHRVWWRQGAAINAGAGHPVVAIGSPALGTTPPLGYPMAAISARPNGTLSLWGWSLDAGTPWRGAEMTLTGPLAPGWHLLELMVAGFGAAEGIRWAAVDGQFPIQIPADWTGIAPTQWIDGQVPDPASVTYVGRDQYDDSRTSPAPQPSHFALDGASAILGWCTPVDVLALDSSGNSAPVPEDAVVTFSTGGAGTFWGDPGCGAPAGPLAALLMPSGTSAVRVYFLPSGVAGSASIVLDGPDYPPHPSSISINAAVDDAPPSTPGQAVPATFVTRGPLLAVSWTGSVDEPAGSGLWGYEVEASRNGGGWQLWTRVPWPTPGVDAGFSFDGGESYWRLRVLARDDAGNISPPGTESAPITVDTTAPERPGAPLVALAGTTAQVSWIPVSDLGIAPSGVQHYALSVAAGASAGTVVLVAGTSTTLDLPPGAYVLRVAARDHAGNDSGFGPQATLTVPGAVTGLRLVGPGAGTADGGNLAVRDQNYPVSVEAIDDLENVVPGYRGQVAFSASGPTSDTSLPAGGPYQFTAADQGRHRFDPGFTFLATGSFVASVVDSNTGAQGRVNVTVIAPGEVRVVEDANPSGAIGVPYLYNAAGAVRVVSSDKVTFSTCGVPSEFLIDRDSGAVRWVPAPGSPPEVILCVQATSAGGLGDSYVFKVALVPLPSGPPRADFSVSPSWTDAGTPALFDPTASSFNPRPPSFRWRFGDGSLPSLRDRPLHSYLLPGGYRPALTLFDAVGRSDQTAREVRMRDTDGNDPPSLIIQTPPPLGQGSLNVQLSAQVLPGSAATGSPRWELGNGAHADGEDAGVTYGPGRTWATAVVVDGHGLLATDKVEISVFDGDRDPPHCLAAADPPVAFLSAGRADITFVGIRAPGSKELTSVSWTIDGVPTPQGAVSRSYSASGWHRGILTVTDGHGLKCTDSVAALVLPSDASTTSAVPPRILDPGARGPALCGKDYDGRPALASGTPPLAWSLLDGPSGMVVDPGTGVASWKPPPSSATGVRYVLRVSGPSGMDTVPVDLAISCRSSVTLDTVCGCGSSGGAPAVAGLLLLGLWAAARRRLCRVRVRGR